MLSEKQSSSTKSYLLKIRQALLLKSSGPLSSGSMLDISSMVHYALPRSWEQISWFRSDAIRECDFPTLMLL